MGQILLTAHYWTERSHPKEHVNGLEEISLELKRGCIMGLHGEIPIASFSRPRSTTDPFCGLKIAQHLVPSLDKTAYCDVHRQE
jgi:hypothetical protein